MHCLAPQHTLRAWFQRATAVALIALAACAAASAQQPLTFRSALDLALKHSGAMVTATADRTKAEQGYREQRAAYIPSVALGSQLGYSFGMPATGDVPSIFSISSNQSLINFAQRSLVRAARSDWEAAQVDYADKANEVLLNTALLYLELDNVTVRLKALREEQQSATRATYIASQRADEGVDSQLDLKRAQLAAARVQMRITEAETSAEVLRNKLARLIGTAADTLTTDHSSIPDLPASAVERDAATLAVETSATVRSAEQRVRSAQFRAQSERDQMKPQMDFYTQYKRLSTFNNYEQYYKSFSNDSFAIGGTIRIPIFNFAERARIRAADAEVVRARQQAIETRSQVSDEALKLQRSLRQLTAAVDVARLEYEVAEASVDSVAAQITDGKANSRDLENARIDRSDRQASYLQSQFELQRAQLQLLRQTGELQTWALPASK